jgi:putative transposase
MSWDQRQRKPSPLDFTDEQWASLEPLLPTPRSKCGGRPREIAMREVINTIVYLNRSGCQRDMRPHDLLLTSSVNDYCTQWRDDGTWTKILAGLRERVRREAGREPMPSAACIDRQSVQTTEVGGEECSDNGGKNIKRRNRHVLVDTMGLQLAVWITRANVDAGAAVPDLLARVSPQGCPRVEPIFGDNK